MRNHLSFLAPMAIGLALLLTGCSTSMDGENPGTAPQMPATTATLFVVTPTGNRAPVAAGEPLAFTNTEGLQLTVMTFPAGAKVKWGSTDPEIATVTNDGLVRPNLYGGEARISVTDERDMALATCTVIVNGGAVRSYYMDLVSINVDRDGYENVWGDVQPNQEIFASSARNITYQFWVVPEPEDIPAAQKQVTVTSGDPTVVRVDGMYYNVGEDDEYPDEAMLQFSTFAGVTGTAEITVTTNNTLPGSKTIKFKITVVEHY